MRTWKKGATRGGKKTLAEEAGTLAERGRGFEQNDEDEEFPNSELSPTYEQDSDE